MDKKDKPPVMETASATSSSEENKSGPFAYILFASVVGITIVLAVVCGGCVSAIVSAAANDNGGFTGKGTYSQVLPYEDIEDLDDLEEWLRRYGGDYDGGESGTTGGTVSKTGTCTVAEALEFDLAPYSASLSNEVSASSYANTPAEVRDFVRNVVSVDGDYATKVSRSLNDAARDEGKQQEKIGEAIALCDEARKAVDAISVPSVSTDKDGMLKDDLGSAKSDTAKRWEKTKKELELLKDATTVSKRELWDLDEDTLEFIEEAGQALEDVMASSVASKTTK